MKNLRKNLQQSQKRKKLTITSSSRTSSVDNLTKVEETLKERGKQYGPFRSQAYISQELKHIMNSNGCWYRLLPDQREGLEMIVHKIARILNGNPDFIDSWVDIAGYAQLVANRLKEKE